MKIFIAHNEYSQALPTAISPTGNEIAFDLKNISANLKEKVYGKIGVYEFTISEMQEMKDAQNGRMEKVGQSTLNNLFK